MPKKKKKKTKAQLEEERRLQEEAEAVAKAEAERKRIEEEKRRAEELERWKEQQSALREAELERLEAEFQEHKQSLADTQVLLEHRKTTKSEVQLWSQYLRCETKINANDEADLNTYLTLTAEAELPELQEALDRAAYSASISLDLRRIMVLAKSCADSAKTAKCADFLRRLYESNKAKLDFATAKLLHLSDRYLDGGTNEIMVVKGSQENDPSLTPVSFGVWVNHEKRGFRMKTLDFTKVGIQCEVPKPLAPHRVAVRNLFLPYDEQSFAGGYVDAEDADSSFLVLGGTYFVDIFEMPPPMRTIKSFEMRPVTSLASEVNRLSYPSLAPLSAEETRGPPATHAPFIRCQFWVPEGVCVSEEPILGWWNDLERHWETDGIEEAEFNEEKRILRFHTLRVGAHALLKNRVEDVPYRSFNLTVMDMFGGDFLKDIDGLPPPRRFKSQSCPECVRMTLVLQTGVKVVLDVGETCCRLVQPSVARLVGEELPASELVQRLGEVGIHIMPSNADALRARAPNSPKTGIVVKSSLLEDQIYEEVAAVAASFDVQNCALNTELGSGKCVFNIRETSVFTGGNEMTLDFNLCLIEEDAGSVLSCNAPGKGIAPGTGVKSTVISQEGMDARHLDMNAFNYGTSHLYLEYALRKDASPEAMERIHTSSVLFQDNVKRLLRLTRPFSFC